MPEKEAVRPEATPLRIDFESRFQRLLASLEVAGLQVRHSQMVLADSRAALGSRTLQVLDGSQLLAVAAGALLPALRYGLL